VDGFLIDNMEVVEHGPNAAEGGPVTLLYAKGGSICPGSSGSSFRHADREGRNATSDVTRLGRPTSIANPPVLDGVSQEESIRMAAIPARSLEMKAWKKMN